jgi:hypothetical protein
MYNKSPVSANYSMIPGYQGYIPANVSDNTYGKSFGNISKENFMRCLANRPNIGVSVDKRLQKVNNMHHTSHKHGISSLSKNHPN